MASYVLAMQVSSFVCSTQTCPNTQKFPLLSPRQSGTVTCAGEVWSEGSVRRLVRPRDSSSSSSKVRQRAAVLDTATEAPAQSQPAADISPEAEPVRQLEQEAVCRSLAGLDIHAFRGVTLHLSADLSKSVWQQLTLLLQPGKASSMFTLAVLACGHLRPPPNNPCLSVPTNHLVRPADGRRVVPILRPGTGSLPFGMALELHTAQQAATPSPSHLACSTDVQQDLYELHYILSGSGQVLLLRSPTVLASDS